MSPRRRKLSCLSYYPTEPGPIHCWLCGLSLEGPEWSKDWFPSVLLGNKEWEDAWWRYMKTPASRRGKFSLYMNASDVARPFENPFEWTVLFRIVVLSLGNKYLPKGYHLSGIGYMPGARTMEKYILAPRDPTIACIGAAKENSKTLRVSPNPHPFSYYAPRRGHLEGYVVHSRCWDLIERKIGSGSLATSRLDLIAQALQKQWDDIIPEVSNRDKHPASWYFDFSNYQNLDDHDKLQDPLFIPEVDSLLQDCAQFSASRVLQEAVSVSADVLSSKYNVPLEIKYLIAQHLNLEDTYNMLIAFGEIFPMEYWKKHVPTDVIFGLEQVDHDSFPWPCLAVEIENRAILKKANGIFNRKRILSMLNPIMDFVLRECNNEDI